MKKLIAILLALVLVFSLAACQGEGGNDTSAPAGTSGNAGNNDGNAGLTDPTDAPTVPPVDAEPLPEEAPLLYWDFETTDGLTAMEQAKDEAGAITGLTESTHPITTTDGVVGKALYLDGKYGVQLDMNGLDIADDCYTISFWIYAERLGDFMPIVQMGRNINSADETLPTAWVNFTRGSWADTYPIVWSRNSSIPWDTDENGVFPWVAGPENVVYGKGEWCLVTVVADGNRYTCLDDNGERIGTKYYLNGELVFDASAEYLYYQGISPELFTGSTVDGFIGINYWDSLYKGYIDELTIYGEALTAGQVKTLYELGDTAMVPTAPVVDGEGQDEPEPEEIVPTPVESITPDESAIEAIGTVACDNGWWTAFSNGYELADGATITLKLNNYSSCGANWNNYVIGLTNVQTTADKAPGADNYEGYAEYAVFRADSYGWVDGATYEWTNSWTDWAAWLQLMADAEVTIVMSRNGSVITLENTYVGADGTTMTSSCTITNEALGTNSCYFFITSELCYVEILSME